MCACVVHLLKMEESTFLILLSLVMLVGSYLAGLIPLVMAMSEVRLVFCLVKIIVLFIGIRIQ